jgi:colicin import membrane protein
MFAIFKNHPRYVIAAIVVHLLVAMVVAVSFHWTSTPTAGLPPIITVHAVVDKRPLETPTPPPPVEAPKTKPEDEAAARQQRDEVQKKLQEAERRREEDRKKIVMEQERDKKRQKQLEEKHQEEMRQEQLTRAKVFKDKIVAEQKRLDEEQKRHEQALLQQEQDRKRQEAEAIAHKAEEKRQVTIIDKYKAMMHQQVRQNWFQQPSFKKKVCILKINMLPTGDVINITIISSSGDPIFDRSVYHAIERASPLPVPPPEAGLFEVFRELNFEFGSET